MLRVNDSIAIPSYELLWSFARSSGKGGQNVNKVNSKAVLKFNLLHSPSLPHDVRERARHKFASMINAHGEVTIDSERHRHQFQNVRDCREKLKNMILLVAAAPKKRVATKPTKSSKYRRLDTKKKHATKKQHRQKKWSSDD